MKAKRLESFNTPREHILALRSSIASNTARLLVLLLCLVSGHIAHSQDGQNAGTRSDHKTTEAVRPASTSSHANVSSHHDQLGIYPRSKPALLDESGAASEIQVESSGSMVYLLREEDSFALDIMDELNGDALRSTQLEINSGVKSTINVEKRLTGLYQISRSERNL